VLYALAFALWIAHVASRIRDGGTPPARRLSGRMPIVLAVLATLPLLAGFRAVLPPWVDGPAASAQKVFCVGVALWLVARARAPRARGDAPFALALTLGLIVRLVTFALAPPPFIDTWVSHETSLSWLDRGINPYTHSIPDIYRGMGATTYGYVAEGYSYPPANLLLLWPFHAAGLDSRAGLAVLEWSGMLAAWSALRRLRDSGVRLAAETILAVFYLQPLGPAVVTSAWTEPLIAGAVGWLFALRARPVAASFAAGVIVALKQHLLFFGLFALPGPGGRARASRALALLAVPALSLLPFAAADLPALLWSMGQTARIRRYRPDNLSLNSIVFHLTGLTTYLPVAAVGATAGALGALAAVILLRRSGVEVVHRHGFAFLATLHFATFAFGYGFTNHHYFVAALITFSLLADLVAIDGGA
jgi:hypothetical protein